MFYHQINRQNELYEYFIVILIFTATCNAIKENIGQPDTFYKIFYFFVVCAVMYYTFVQQVVLFLFLKMMGFEIGSSLQIAGADIIILTINYICNVKDI